MAATRSNKFGKEALDLILCPICKEDYTDPRLLHCGHSFCLECLEKWSQQRANQHGRRLVCPTCKEITPLTTQGVAHLPKDFKVNQIKTAFLQVNVTAQNKTTGRVMPTVCAFCKVHKSMFYCSACTKTLCSQCNDRHQQNTLFRGHQTKACSVEEEALTLTCEFHTEEVIQYFCLTCQKALCAICAMEVLHDDHKTTTLLQGLENCKTSLRVLQGPLNTRQNELTASQEEASNIRKEIESSYIRSKELLERTTDTLVALVQQWESDMTLKLNKSYEETIKTHKQYTNALDEELTQIVNLSEAISEIDSNEFEIISIVTKAEDLTKRFEQMSNYEVEKHADVTLLSCEHFTHTAAVECFLNSEYPFRTKQFSISDYDDVVLPPQERTSRLLWSIFKRSSQNGDIMSPISVSFTPNEDAHILVSEFDSGRVQIFDKMGHTIGKITNISPKDAVMGNNDKIYVVDSSTNEILIFTLNGEKLSNLGAGRLKDPRSVAIKSDGTVVVVDKETCKVTVHAKNGALKYTSSEKEFSLLCPVAVRVDSKDRIFVADRELNLVAVFDGMCKFLFEVCPEILQDTEGAHLQNMCIDEQDNIYLCMHTERCVLKYDSSGKYLKKVLDEQDGIKYPSGIAAGPDGYFALVESKVSVKHSALKMFKLN